jgi:tetratricopeptide (TPR) repeat protein
VHLRLGQPTEALAHYEQGHSIDEKLAAADPANARAQRGLSISHGKLGDVQRQLGQPTEALALYEQGLAIDEKLAAADPADAQAQRDLAVSHNSLGDVRMELGQPTEALAHYEQSLAIREKLAAADPADARAQRDLMVGHYQLGALHQATFEFTRAAEAFSRGLADLEEFSTRTGRQPFVAETADLKQRIQSCKRAETAILDLGAATGEPVQTATGLILLRVQALAAYASGTAKSPESVRDKWPGETGPRDMLAEAQKSADKLRELAAADAGNLYNAACCYGICLKTLGKLAPPDCAAMTEALRRQALDALQAAIAAGWNDAAHIAKDPDLAPLRDLPEFQELLKSMEAKPKPTPPENKN